MPDSSLEGGEIALGLGLAPVFSAGHGHMFMPPAPCQHPDISGVLLAFHHPSFVFGFTSAAVLSLPDVTHIPQKVGLLPLVLSLGFSPAAAARAAPQGFFPLPKQAAGVSLLFSYLPPALFIPPVLVYSKSSLHRAGGPGCAGPTSGSSRLFTFQKLIICHHVFTLQREKSSS